jgi:biopolymer transport protein ExbB/TolQ
MAIYDDVKITINLNELVEIRAKLISQYDDYSEKVNKGEYLDKGDIDRIAVKLRETLTFDTIFQMIDESILEYLGIKEKNPSTTIETIELTMEKEKKEREKQFKKQFELVSIVNPSWTIEVPRIKR